MLHETGLGSEHMEYDMKAQSTKAKLINVNTSDEKASAKPKKLSVA